MFQGKASFYELAIDEAMQLTQRAAALRASLADYDLDDDDDEFDDDVFENPSEFNVLRNPNPHLGFGGQGTHFCLGANLARTEINLMFNAIADVLPDITKLGEPKRLRSAWLNGVTGFDVRYR